MHADELLRHRAFLRGLAAALIGSEDGADDVVQDAYVAALGCAPDRPRAWLATVVRNLVRRRGRTALRRRAREQRVARPEGVGDAGSAVARLEIQRRVVDAVLELPEPYRSTIVQRYLEDRTTREMAARSGTPYETVRTRLTRGLALLRARLDESARGWVPALAPLVGTPARWLWGGLAMTGQKATLVLGAVLVLGAALGAGGYAAWSVREPERRAGAERASVPGAPAGELEALRLRVAQLQQDNEALRAQLAATDGEAGTEPRDAPDGTGTPGPKAGPKPGTELDWRNLLPLFRELARTGAQPGQDLDSGLHTQFSELLAWCHKNKHLEAMGGSIEVRDIWAAAPLGSRVAYAFARELQPDLAPQARDEIEAALREASAALPSDALDIERLAASARRVADTEAVLAKHGGEDLARRTVAEVAPLWRRAEWQTMHLGPTTPADLQSLFEMMTGAMTKAEKQALTRTVRAMTASFANVRADLVRRHGKEAVRAVLVAPGGGGADEATLALARKAPGYARIERLVHAAIARNQARYEREHYRSLGPKGKESYKQLGATLLLFELRGD